MTTEEKIIKEFVEHGELKNSLALLHYGTLLSEAIRRHQCSLDEMLHAINISCQQKVADLDLGRAIS